MIGDIGTLLIGVAAMLSLVNTVRTRQDTKSLKAEFQPNGGSSLRDAINRVEHKLHGVDVRLVAVEEYVTKPTGQLPVVKKTPAKSTAAKAAPKKGTK